jgi:hypothetical protein
VVAAILFLAVVELLEGTVPTGLEEVESNEMVFETIFELKKAFLSVRIVDDASILERSSEK